MSTQPVSLTIVPEKCTACMACELACSFTKEEVFSPSLSRIRVARVFEAGINVPVACINCAHAPCMDACPTGAIVREGPLGIVRVDSDICNGCGDCVEVCPYGAVYIPEGEFTAFMCDLCGGDPACVPNCIYGALTYTRQPDALFSTLETTALIEVGEARRLAVASHIAHQIRAGWEVEA